MSTLAIVLIVLAVVVLLFLIGGIAGARRRDERQAPHFEEHVRAADQALETARAGDRGWDKALMEAAAQKALEEARPGWSYDDLHLVLVDDQPGVEEDRAEFVAVGGGEEARLRLSRRGDRWIAEHIG